MVYRQDEKKTGLLVTWQQMTMEEKRRFALDMHRDEKAARPKVETKRFLP